MTELQHLSDLGAWVLVALLLCAAWCAGLIAREMTLLLSKQPRPHDRLPVLGALAAAAPLLGLLGTVSGLVQMFTANLPPESVAAGIAQALLTTQVGLVIAVPTLLARQLLLRWRERQAVRGVLA